MELNPRGVIVSYQAQTPVLGMVLPSNSPGVHTLWLPVIPMQIGLVLKPGPQEPWTPYRMAAAFIAAGIPREAIGVYPGAGEMGAEVVNRCQRTMIFGSTETVKRYEGNPHVQVHGPGFSKVLLGDDEVDNWEKYIDLIVDSVYLNSGRGCINCSGVWASRHTKEIAQALAERLGPIDVLPPDDPKAALAAFTVPGQAQTIHAQILEKARTNHEDMTAKFGPRLVEKNAALHPTVGSSLRFPRSQDRQHRIHVSLRHRRRVSAESDDREDRTDSGLLCHYERQNLGTPAH
jgi:acyl-CoA reductase-like NAD-dependent aldehyde dehydrogenase